ncbi:MAG: family 43 glycosylhydrolase [Eubacterium sp.]|nr:family 43 glycosylhydrolase [Eubacterium sp.]
MTKKCKKLLTGVLVFAMSVTCIATGMIGKNTEAQAARSSLSRVSVHDPNIFKDTDGTYYAFGSHLATAKSTDLRNWTQMISGYNDTSANIEAVYGDLDTNFAEPFLWAGKNECDSYGGHSVWAPNVIYNEDYVNEDNSKGAYMMYVCTSSTYIRSAIGFAVSQNAEGPYEYKDTLIYSGFTSGDAYDTYTVDSTTQTSYVNKNYTNTNIDELIADGTLSGVNSSWFNNDGSYNNNYAPNAIDPTVFTTPAGKMYMTYGSWSGGLFILEIDPATGKAIYPGTTSTDSDTGLVTDAYFGTRIAGRNHVSGEAPFINYDAETGYYYLYETYGGLTADGGYNMRMYRSQNPCGPYVDAAGNQAQNNYLNLNSYGVKLEGNYAFTG